MTATATVPVTEHDMITALKDRYSAVNPGNGPRYVYASGVRSRAGIDARRTADFIAIDTWPSSRFAVHGHEVKVSRSDWLRELKDPAKAGEFLPYMTYWWLVVPDVKIVDPAELPPGWGLMALSRGRLGVYRKAARCDAEPMPMDRLIPFMRSIQATRTSSRAEADLRLAVRAERERTRQLVHEHLTRVCATRGSASVAAAEIRAIHRELLAGGSDG